MARSMLCISCEYDLTAVGTGRCPECGREFDPANPWTDEIRSRRDQATSGILLSIGLGATAYALFKWSLDWPYGESHHAAFRSIMAIGAALGVIGALLAARYRSWLGRTPLLLTATICIWAGLFFASDTYYRVWQASEDPPDEAFADTGPLGALLFGWIPGGLAVGVVFAAVLLRSAWRRRGVHRSLPRQSHPSKSHSAATLDASVTRGDSNS